MSDGETPDALEPEPENDVIRTLREQVKEGKVARAEADAAKRELEFVKAGVDVADPRMGYFVRGYQGDISADAIRSAATDAGFLGTQSSSSEPEGMSEAERQAFRATSEAAAGPTTDTPPVDIYKEFEGQNWRSGETAENYGVRLAAAVEAAGGEVLYRGPFRETASDTGITSVRANTPVIRQRS